MRTIFLISTLFASSVFASPHLGGLGKQIRPHPHRIIVSGPVINGRH